MLLDIPARIVAFIRILARVDGSSTFTDVL